MTAVKPLCAALLVAALALSCTDTAIMTPKTSVATSAAKAVTHPGGMSVTVEPWVEGLQIPWSLVFLPDGSALVSERPGTIRMIKDGVLLPAPYAKIAVAHQGEGGLMGLALHPEFPSEPYVYAMHTYWRGESVVNRVIRLRHEGDTGTMDSVVLDWIPGARYHNGGRIAFGPDGMLYIATGEAGTPSLSQDPDNLAGKILRLTPEGKVPPDNPHPGSAVYSMGHRNPQGLAWHPETGELFASEHGPSGEFGKYGNDEINVIHPGGNYGWPKAIGAPGMSRYTDPLVLWIKSTPPGGIAFYGAQLFPELKGDLLVATLRSEALARVKLSTKARGAPPEVEMWFEGELGRLRDVVVGPDGAIYVLTSNTDGRGNPREGDDKIYRITPLGLR